MVPSGLARLSVSINVIGSARPARIAHLGRTGGLEGWGARARPAPRRQRQASENVSHLHGRRSIWGLIELSRSNLAQTGGGPSGARALGSSLIDWDGRAHSKWAPLPPHPHHPHTIELIGRATGPLFEMSALARHRFH